MTAKSDIAGRIAIVIVDYNSEALLRRCLDSLLGLGREDLVFIVVDNGGSIDDSGFHGEYPGSILLRPGCNIGFAGGCNMGLRAALDGEAAWCLLLNPDTRAVSDFLTPLISAFDADPRLGMACPTILTDDDAQDIWFAGGKINWWIGRPISVRDRRLLDRGGTQPVPYLTGCAMMLRPSAVREVGLMEDSYFLYFEDTDYTRAFIAGGWQAAYVPAAELLHSPSSTTGFQSDSYIYYFARNRILFMRRWASWLQWIVFLLFHSLVRLPGAVLVFGLLRRRPGAALAFVKGWAAGIAGR